MTSALVWVVVTLTTQSPTLAVIAAFGLPCCSSLPAPCWRVVLPAPAGLGRSAANNLSAAGAGTQLYRSDAQAVCPSLRRQRRDSEKPLTDWTESGLQPEY